MRSRSGGKNLRYGLEMAGLVGALMIGFVAFGPLQRAKAGLNRASILAEAEPSGAGKGSPEQKVTLTFNRDIAPIIFQHCAVCHRPGQSAPFSLLSYGDVKKQVKQVAEVVTKRFMPPWLPAKGYGEFAGDPSLSEEQVARISKWVAEGAKEGEAEDLPPLPKWNEGWQLGKPDLVVRAEQPYSLSATGKDVFRNLVIPVPTSER